jgi:hypothetical protein
MSIQSKRGRGRRRGAFAASILAALIVVGGATMVSAFQSEQKAPTPPRRVPTNKPLTSLSRAEATARLEKVREARRQEGKHPVKDQLASKSGVSRWPGSSWPTRG